MVVKKSFQYRCTSKKIQKLAFKVTIAKLADGYEAFVEHDGKAIPFSALGSNITRQSFAYTKLEEARAYLQNTPSKEALAVKIKV